MRKGLIALAAAAFCGAVLGPVVAVGDSAPQVVLATPGMGGGAVERYTVRFSEPMVPLGDPRAQTPWKIDCPVGGTGRWVDTTTYVHEFEKPLPGGLTCKFELRQGLMSAKGIEVAGGRSFSVDTGGPTARAILPGRYDGRIEEDGQIFLIAANVPADRGSVAGNAYCSVDGIGEKIAVDVLDPSVTDKILTGLGKDTYTLDNFLSTAGLPQPVPADAKARADALKTVTALKCRRPLPPGRDMALVWGAGIRSADGRTAGADQRFDFTVRKAFEASFSCSRVNPQAGCNPVLKASVQFTAPIPIEQAKAIRIEAGGKTLAAKIDDDDKNRAHISSVSFAAPLPAGTIGKLILPDGVKDESGRPLANAQRFPLDVRFDVAPPLVKFAAPFGIIEAKEGGTLPVTVRNVEPALQGRSQPIAGKMLEADSTSDAAIARWLREIETAGANDFREEKRGGEDVTVNHTGTRSILTGAAAGKAMSVPLPGKGKDFEVVGIPLKDPGFYVVELASPTLGEALLGRKTTRYVAAGALVTNMSVHFKWGRGASLAWVTALDTGKPVAGADVRVSDSCTGRLIARGASDALGRVLIKGGLPEPETYGDCKSQSADAPHPLMVSARKAGDFSFTLTEWGEGIRPYDFDLPYGWSKPDDIVHTLFDRTLLRAGETVNMKHILRRPIATGFGYAEPIDGTLRLVHRGSDTQFEMPLKIAADGIGESRWSAPEGAPMGDYDLQIVVGERTIYTDQSIKLDEFRLPTMRATVTGPKEAQVRPKRVPLDLFVGYLSGGGAASLPVRIRTAFTADDLAPAGYEGWSFGGRLLEEGTKPLDGEGEEIAPPLPPAQTLPVTLDAQGTARTAIDIPATITGGARMVVEMDYEDANGEVLTASRRVPIHASGVQLGMKGDGWLMKQDDMRLRFVALGLDGKPIRGQRIRVDLYSREILTARRRLIGGFYAYDNQAKVTKLSAECTAITDSQGLATCAVDPGVSGEVYAVATTEDGNGNVAHATRSLWLAGDDDWWFGGDNGDRMDLVAEQPEYKAGETARFQVRMPFREATALVTVEREGVLSSYVTRLSGKDPVVEVAMPGAYAPEVYVSVMAVRGRVGGFRLWLSDLARRWGLPFFARDVAKPTALVDLAKPSYRLGMAKVKVGWEGHRLAVAVKADKKSYAVRETAHVAVEVKGPDGKAPKSAEIAFAAVDEALLQLQPNESWKLIEAMMVQRPVAVLTSTAQTQVVGKRHYGKKAVEAGGGGGGDLSALNREDFRPVLLWRGRVPLDAAGRAQVDVPLSDALSSFKLVAIATSGAGLFGTGELAVRTTQDLQILSGIPPLVRTGDQFGATFTLRNTTDKPMTVTATVGVNPAVAQGRPLTVTIPAGKAEPVTWHLTAPANVDRLNWTVEAKSDGGAADRISVAQDVIPAVPVETWAGTLVRVGAANFPVAPPAGALPGTGVVDIKLSATLAPPLEGVRAYMAAYPYGCFEQQLSRAVALDDPGAWTRLSGEIPAYLDEEGLLRYWPSPSIQGSEALTAYVLSITAESGWAIPDGARAKMIEALKAVVEGRLRRDTAYAGDQRLLRVAALAALARNGAADPAMFGQLGLAPGDMPTALLADWMVAIDRTPGLANAQALRLQAEKVLRTRLVYEGSRVDLVDAGNAPWWMMVTGDESVLRALLAVLGRPGWEDDVPRLMVGAALRQSRGHWDTTPANAWGSVTARRFGSLYPASAITGVTMARLGSETRQREWPQAADAAPLRFPLPAAKTPLVLTQQGGAGPWAMVQVKAAVPLLQPLYAGYRMTKQVSVLEQKVPGRLTRGDVLKVRITVDSTADRQWVVVNDPIPGGATIVGTLGGQSQLLADAASGGEGVQPSYVERGRDSWRGYFEWVPRGTFTVEYTVRLNGVGRFNLPPTRVEAMYSPDIRAQVPNGQIAVALR
ncbi:alpha-2-macroglobulin family protein [Sphingomonas sanxanigenens]|uniref:Alpha-2-macroglobulin n=1 Tax=Sphingomonas sanxanigenens DSM 19645 = NX02 TaxID=1123269 RepID=W0AKI1_9SPHN|nr:MG2 domain-containing protein [Sphingomonas sanxanigenens]AHE57052.1 hypothetical protein NX02_27330 [Sphingomonas sanxanigenens DSM 19645 = NX02]